MRAIVLPTPPAFSFRRTVRSHGWCRLPPFELEDGADVLATTVGTGGGTAYRITLRPHGEAVALAIAGRPTPRERRRLVAAGRRILGLDLDLEPFHEAVRRVPHLAWIAATGTGRLLRAPTAWEDLVKLVLTTNCSWSLTTRMSEGLVALSGDGSFPSPERLASIPEPALRDEVKAGYRAPYLARLARIVASGEVDPETWDLDDRDPETLRAEILSLPGVGPYVAENVLKFLGRPRGLALDSWMRAKYARLHHRGRPVTDRTIARRYAALGTWAGLAVWFELTRDWLDGDGTAGTWDSLT